MPGPPDPGMPSIEELGAPWLVDWEKLRLEEELRLVRLRAAVGEESARAE